MKQKIVAALLAFFLGVFGFHWFYVNDEKKGKKYLIWCIVGLLTMFIIIGFIPLIVLGILSLVDCFRFLLMSDDEFDEKYNKKSEHTILND